MPTEPSAPPQIPAKAPAKAANEALRTTVVPLLLMLTTPLALILAWMACAHYHGSLLEMARSLDGRALLEKLPLPSLAAARLILTFAAVQAVLMLLLPGRTHLGPITPTGNRPSYKLNGIPAFVLTHSLFWLGAWRGWFSPGVVYTEFGPILMSLTIFALLFCLFLYFKGAYFPSSSDAGRSGNFIWDYYWGVELHPQLGGFNLKQYCNCRLGMMGWSVVIVSFAARQYELYGHVSNSMLISVGLQLVYIAKFFYWESGYFGSLDIMHDRFGYYICWGVLCWVTGIYTLVAQYLVEHPIELSIPFAVFCVVLGLASIWVNYAADAQRQRVRQTNGQTKVWGRAPSLMKARYRTADGTEHENLLLCSGWWGVARHFHYVPEILLTLAWTLPAGATHFLPYFYVVFLTILLVDRSGRDELRCQTKYGEYWDEYRRRVKWRILPFVY